MDTTSHLCIAVGSTNPVKIKAVHDVATIIWPEARIQPIRVDSGVGPMPANAPDGKKGALQRARQALSQANAHLGVGLEGALQEEPEGLYIANWAAVVDRKGHYAIGNGGMVLLPTCIAQAIREGAELGPLIDVYSGEANSKEHLGAAGYLTMGIVSRVEAFRIAVAFALAPFLRPELYGVHQAHRP